MSHEPGQAGESQNLKHYKLDLKQKSIWKTYLTKIQKVQDYLFNSLHVVNNYNSMKHCKS